MRRLPPIEGDRAKRFRIFRCNSAGDLVEPALAEFDSIGEVLAYRWRLDYLYRIRVGRELFTLPEFKKWAERA